jgi:hypothetical protein
VRNTGLNSNLNILIIMTTVTSEVQVDASKIDSLPFLQSLLPHRQVLVMNESQANIQIPFYVFILSFSRFLFLKLLWVIWGANSYLVVVKLIYLT